MGFFSSSSRRISFDEAETIIERASGLRGDEKAYVIGVFERYRSHGLGQREIKEGVAELKRNHGDTIGRSQADRIKQELLGALSE
jgi:hypothetical protein